MVVDGKKGAPEGKSAPVKPTALDQPLYPPLMDVLQQMILVSLPKKSPLKEKDMP